MADGARGAAAVRDRMTQFLTFLLIFDLVSLRGIDHVGSTEERSISQDDKTPIFVCGFACDVVGTGHEGV